MEDATLLDQLLRRVELGYLTLVEHDHAVAVKDGVDTVRDCDNGTVGEQVAAQRLLEQRVRLHVHGRRGLVENQDVGWSEQGSGQGDQLTLTLGEVGSWKGVQWLVLQARHLMQLFGRGGTTVQPSSIQPVSLVCATKAHRNPVLHPGGIGRCNATKCLIGHSATTTQVLKIESPDIGARGSART